jgi:hypothetical protein
MARLSLWKDGKHSNDYKFFDRRISEMFTMGGTGIIIHKYLGTNQQTDSTDLTQPNYTNQSEKNIQDLLFVENRDRKYDRDVYKMRGIYTRADQDFDLSQFGLFLQTGTLFMTFHINDMMDTIGRKLMAGDVLELEHLKDYNALDQDVPAALKRYYVIADASLAAEGFTPTWWPHLWRVKINPLVDSQEYKDILNTIVAGTASTTTADIMSNYGVYMNINAAVVAQAEVDVPLSGYDTSKMYLAPEYGGIYANSSVVTADSVSTTADETTISPADKLKGYLVGDGLAPDGLPCGTGIEFPTNPSKGDYFLRTDYLPNRLFRFSGARWSTIEEKLRANLTLGAESGTLRNSFVNNTNTSTNIEGETVPERQSLSKAFKLRADN